MGTYVLSAGQYQDYYLKAAQVRTLVVKSFPRPSRCDLIVTPTAPTLAGKDPGRMICITRIVSTGAHWQPAWPDCRR